MCILLSHRMECLEKVNKREADFLAVDPEDMYVAFNMKNEDFSIFSEIRTVEEPDGKNKTEIISDITIISDFLIFIQLNSDMRESYWCIKTRISKR